MAARMPRTSSKTLDFDASMRIVILYGKEPFLIQEASQRLVTRLQDTFGDIEQFSFDGDSAGLADVLDELRSYGLIQRHKLVTVANADKFLSREGHRPAAEGYVKSTGIGRASCRVLG